MAFAFSTDFATKALNFLFKVGGTPASSFTNAALMTMFTSADASLGTITITLGAASGGKVTSSSTSNTISAGTIAKARAGNSNPASAMLTVGVAGSGADVILSTLTGGGSVTMSNCSFAVLSASSDGVKLNTALRNAIAELYRGSTTPSRLVTSTTGSSNTGRLRLYSGSAPASADSAATGTMLWDREMLSADFNTAASGSIGLASTLSVNASATGTVGYGRLELASGPGLQFTVATDTSAHVQLDTLSATSGSPLVVQSFNLAFV